MDKSFPKTSITLVNFNGKKFLKKCLDSLFNLNYSKDKIEIILVDNGSTDGSLDFVKQSYPSVIVIKNDVNNFAHALNIAFARSTGEYFALLNNDVEVDKDWLAAMVNMLDTDPRIGCVGGKILFDDRSTINSVGHEVLPDFYFQDKGFKEKDEGQYDVPCASEGISGGSILYRRACLEDIGAFDEDYVMYFEDVDMAYRCRAKGWKMMYTPDSIVYHRFHGTSGNSNLTYLFCNRNRFFFLARHLPNELPASIRSSHLFLNENFDFLVDCIPQTIAKLVEHASPEVIRDVLPKTLDELSSFLSPAHVNKIISRYQIQFRRKKPSLAIYDHALHLIGGGQKYVATLAAILQETFDITYLANIPVEIKTLEQWYGLDLSRVKIKIIPMPFLEEKNPDAIDPSLVNSLEWNPFDVISQETAKYDLFFNANMTEKVYPLSSYSIFMCHFPDSVRSKYFYTNNYSLLLANSKYTAGWVKERWGLDVPAILYPPVDMYPGKRNDEKQNVILSVARFEIGGSKKQLEMIEAFIRLCDALPEVKRRWRFILAGGSVKTNPYLGKLTELLKTKYREYPIEICVNIGLSQLRELYNEAKIFWHACGLNETNPHLIEHFGMTTVEAMQNYCVPVVINGGGQREIVEQGRSGFLFSSVDELVKDTQKLIDDPALLGKLSDGAFFRSKQFEKSVFQENVLKLFHAILQKEFLHTVRSVDDLKSYFVADFE